MLEPTVCSSPSGGGSENLHTILFALDLAGTFVFAISGAMAGVKRRLDLFGVLVISFAAATSGGIARDVVIGAIPPAAIGDWRYPAVSILAGVMTFYAYSFVKGLRSHVLLFDAAGLALFAVTGTEKAFSHGLDPVPAALLGMLTGIGGGIARDLLLAEIPTVLRAEIYAVAALAGSTVVAVGHRLALPPVAVAIAGAFLCFFLRYSAIRRGWRLPIAESPDISAIDQVAPVVTSRPKPKNSETTVGQDDSEAERPAR